MRIFEHFGVTTGRTSRDQAANGKEISLDQIQPGDLLFYASGKTINHVALYIGDGKIIHASASNGVLPYSGESGYLLRLRAAGIYYAAICSSSRCPLIFRITGQKIKEKIIKKK